MNKGKSAPRKTIMIKAPTTKKPKPAPPEAYIPTDKPVHPPRPSTGRGSSARAPRFQPLRINGPLKPSVVLANHKEYLTHLEEKEISSYEEVYYLRPRVPQDKTVNAVAPERFQFVTNEHIAYRFQMLKVLGKCSFGGVIKCIDHKTGNEVAIKFLRDHHKHHRQIALENDFIQKLQKEGPEKHHIIKLLETFSYHGYFCFVMELGTEDVYQALQAQKFVGFPMQIVQVVAKQGMEALKFMKSRGIMHCDFKPENILFMTRRRDLIKLIDYGCSSETGDMIYTYIQSRFYRAPEIVIGVDYGPEIDVWSFACVLCEMVTGKPVFDAEDEQELIQMHMKILGVPPKWMVESGKRSEYYFDDAGKPIIEPNSCGVVHRPGTSNLTKETGIKDQLFMSLIAGCLKWDPKQRFTPDQILHHPWLRQKYGEIPSPVPHTART